MAVLFNNATDYLQRTASLPSSVLWTVCGWAKRTSDPNVYHTLFQINPSGASDWMFLGTTADGTTLCITTAGGQTNFASSPAQDGWFFWAASCQGTGAADYVAYWSDAAVGTMVSATLTGLSFTPTQIWIGSDDVAHYWRGNIGAIKMWDAVLTQDELLREKWLTRPSRLTNIHLWTPARTAAEVAIDFSGAARNLTIGGTLDTVDGPPVGWGAAALIVGGSTAVAAEPDETGAFYVRKEIGKSGLRRGAALRAPNASGYTETGLVVSAAAILTLSDLERYKELGLAVAAVGVVARTDVEHYREVGLAVSIAGLVSAAEAQHYKDTGLAIPVVGVVSETDAKKYNEAGLAITAVGVVAEADVEYFRDAGLAVSAVGTVTVADALHARDVGLPVTIVGTATLADVEHYREAALAVPISGLVTELDKQHFHETGLAITAQAQAALTDLEHYKDLGLGITAQAIVTLASEVYHGGVAHYTETGLAVVIVGAASVSDLQHYLEASLPIAAQAVLSLGLERGHYADAVQVLAAATLTATDVEHWRESLTALAVGTVALTDAQRYREVGLLVQAVASVSVTESQHLSRIGPPDIVFRMPARLRSFALPRVGLTAIVPQWWLSLEDGSDLLLEDGTGIWSEADTAIGCAMPLAAPRVLAVPNAARTFAVPSTPRVFVVA